ncbi:MAG: type I methionyl aminopeptidase [Mycobacteriales bacterium]
MEQIESLKTSQQIGLMREAGLVVAGALAVVRGLVAPGVSTAELNDAAYSCITDAGAKPSFLGYRDFPATLCTSVNEEIVHGIPSARRVLRDGDMVSIDCGAIVDGWHGDSAITVPVGEVRPQLARLIEVCTDAMWAGIAAAKVGGHLSDISAAVERAVKHAANKQGNSDRYGIVRGYGGHGIGTRLHEDPYLSNYGKAGRGPLLATGTVLAIEPMITLGSASTRELADGWTVVSKDGSAAAHTEHTFALTEDGVFVLTQPDGGSAQLGEAASGLCQG